ncbi:MAG: hypothetical protein Q3971_04950 [Moraxella sp.]|nr:hypothetical protein [Moraxella sp.]
MGKTQIHYPPVARLPMAIQTVASIPSQKAKLNKCSVFCGGMAYHQNLK